MSYGCSEPVVCMPCGGHFDGRWPTEAASVMVVYLPSNQHRKLMDDGHFFYWTKT